MNVADARSTHEGGSGSVQKVTVCWPGGTSPLKQLVLALPRHSTAGTVKVIENGLPDDGSPPTEKLSSFCGSSTSQKRVAGAVTLYEVNPLAVA